MRKKALKLIKKNKYIKYLSGTILMFIIGIILFSVLIWPIRNIYYSLFDGNYFLNVQKVAAQSIVDQNKDAIFIMCRQVRANIVTYNNYRFFFVHDDGRYFESDIKQLPDGERIYDLNIDCVPLIITPQERPNEPGVYKFCQSISFTIKGHDKEASFCSDDYTIKG